MIDMRKVIVLCLVMLNLFQIASVNAQVPNWDWAKDGSFGPTGIFGHTGFSEGSEVITDISGNMYFTGEYQWDSIQFGSFYLDSPGQSIFLVKYNPTGTVRWAKTSKGNNVGWSKVATDNLGNVYLVGSYGSSTISFGSITLTNTTTTNYADGFLIKYDSIGNVIWAGDIGGTGNDVPSSIAIDPIGNVLISGYYNSPNLSFSGTNILSNSSGNYETFIAKYDSSGNIIWAKSSISNNNDYSYSITTDNLGNAYIGGTFSSTNITFQTTSLTNNSGGDAFLVKYDSSGNVLSAQNSVGAGTIYSIASISSGKLFITGNYSSNSITFGSHTLNGPGQYNAFAAEYNSLGTVDWIKGSSDSKGWTIVADASGNSYISGSLDTTTITFDTITIPIIVPHTNDQMFLIKLDALGNGLWAKTLGSGGDDVNSVAIDNTGNVYFGGDYLASPFIIGNDTLIKSGTEVPFVAKLSYPSIEAVSLILNPTSEVEIYPNPATTSFTVTSTGSKIKEINVFTVLGELVNSEQAIGNNQSTINVSQYSKGIYFVQITDENKNVATRKIVIE